MILSEGMQSNMSHKEVKPLRYKEVTDAKSVNELLAQNYRIVSISVKDGAPLVLMVKK